MSKKKSKSDNKNNSKNDRRTFLKKVGQGILITSSYSLISLTNFSCSSSSSPTGNGYN